MAEGLMRMPKYPLSKKTLRRASIFLKGTKAAGITVGDAKYPDDDDTIVFFIATDTITCIVYCTPYAYLLEYYREEGDGINVGYAVVSSVKKFIKFLANFGFASWTDVHKDIIDRLESGEINPEDLE
eukprot:GHVU01172214.1.p2 GENE.GHVU01172214.1~~GHVU01172214.1.p2  ORF type:complete len:127 (-),score=17.17 GHVU01172214.1:1517-1897(-)